MKTTLAAAAAALVLAACAAVPCTPVTVPAGIDSQCFAGGNYCASCEGQHCAGTWPLRKHCTTVYTTAGTCNCACQ